MNWVCLAYDRGLPEANTIHAILLFIWTMEYGKNQQSKLVIGLSIDSHTEEWLFSHCIFERICGEITLQLFIPQTCKGPVST